MSESEIAIWAWVIFGLFAIVGALAVAVFAVSLQSMERFYFNKGPFPPWHEPRQ